MPTPPFLKKIPGKAKRTAFNPFGVVKLHRDLTLSLSQSGSTPPKSTFERKYFHLKREIKGKKHSFCEFRKDLFFQDEGPRVVRELILHLLLRDARVLPARGSDPLPGARGGVWGGKGGSDRLGGLIPPPPPWRRSNFYPGCCPG